MDGLRVERTVDAIRGNKILNINNLRLNGASPTLNVTRQRFLDAWSTTNPNGKYQRIGAGAGFLNADITDELLEDGSFVRLRTISLSRQIPKAWLRQAGVSARAYVTALLKQQGLKYTLLHHDDT